MLYLYFVESPDNIALGKQFYPIIFTRMVHMAVDGFRFTGCGLFGHPKWFAVDLGKTYNIKEVILTRSKLCLMLNSGKTNTLR